MPPTIHRFDFRREPVTMILLAVIVALEIFFNLRPEARYDFYNESLGIWLQIWEGQLWRPFTSCLMHGDLIHMAFNAFWLALFGQALEERFGSWRFLGLVVLLGYVSTLPGYVLDGYFRDTPHASVGFSGIGYGLFGLILVGRRYVPQWQLLCDRQTVQLFIGWFFLCIALTVADIWTVNNVAHGAGFIFGGLYGMAIFERKRRPLWIALSAVLSLAVLATMIACPGHPHYEFVRQIGGGPL